MEVRYTNRYIMRHVQHKPVLQTINIKSFILKLVLLLVQQRFRKYFMSIWTNLWKLRLNFLHLEALLADFNGKCTCLSAQFSKNSFLLLLLYTTQKRVNSMLIIGPKASLYVLHHEKDYNVTSTKLFGCTSVLLQFQFTTDHTDSDIFL
jgi:hypothetical protein